MRNLPRAVRNPRIPPHQRPCKFVAAHTLSVPLERFFEDGKMAAVLLLASASRPPKAKVVLKKALPPDLEGPWLSSQALPTLPRFCSRTATLYPFRELAVQPRRRLASKDLGLSQAN